jgi:hypothetical protein
MTGREYHTWQSKFRQVRKCTHSVTILERKRIWFLTFVNGVSRPTSVLGIPHLSAWVISSGIPPHGWVATCLALDSKLGDPPPSLFRAQNSIVYVFVGSARYCTILSKTGMSRWILVMRPVSDFIKILSAVLEMLQVDRRTEISRWMGPSLQLSVVNKTINWILHLFFQDKIHIY